MDKQYSTQTCAADFYDHITTKWKSWSPLLNLLNPYRLQRVGDISSSDHSSR